MKQKDNSKILSNKNCLVTGATGGLGIEICRILLEKECNIFLTSTNKLKLKNIEIELSKNFKDSKIFSHETDLRKTDQIKKLIEKVKKEMETVEIIINCAGIFSSKSIDNTTLNEFEDIFNQVSLLSIYQILRTLLLSDFFPLIIFVHVPEIMKQ